MVRWKTGKIKRGHGPIRREHEFDLQVRVVNYMRSKNFEGSLFDDLLFNGSAGGIRTSLSQGKKMKMSGYRKGWPDLLIMEPRGEFHGLAIELKVKGNYGSPDQKEVIKELIKRGYFAQICTGYEEATETIDMYFKL